MAIHRSDLLLSCHNDWFLDVQDSGVSVLVGETPAFSRPQMQAAEAAFAQMLQAWNLP